MLLFGTNFISTLAAAVATAASWDVSGDGSNCIPVRVYCRLDAVRGIEHGNFDQCRCAEVEIDTDRRHRTGRLDRLNSNVVPVSDDIGRSPVNGVAASGKRLEMSLLSFFPPCLTKNHNHL